MRTQSTRHCFQEMDDKYSIDSLSFREIQLSDYIPTIKYIKMTESIQIVPREDCFTIMEDIGALLGRTV